MLRPGLLELVVIPLLASIVAIRLAIVDTREACVSIGRIRIGLLQLFCIMAALGTVWGVKAFLDGREWYFIPNTAVLLGAYAIPVGLLPCSVMYVVVTRFLNK